MNFKDVSWIKKKEQLSVDAIDTKNRLDDSIKFRSTTVKKLINQKQTNPKVNISDALFNEVQGFGPASTLPYNKARLKLFKTNVSKVDNIIGKSNKLNHI